MRDFTSGKISKPLVAFAAPMLIGNLFQQMYSIVDAMVVGQFVGGGALAAVGVSISIVMFLSSTTIGLTTGAALLIAQFFGAKQYDRLKKAVSVSIIFLTALATVMTVLGIIFTPQLLRLLDAPPEVFDDALLYMRMMIGGLIFTVFYNMYTAYMRALGETRRPLYILMFSVVLSGILTVYLVGVLNMGVFGAAVSTLFSQLLAAVLSYIYTRRKMSMLIVEKMEFDFQLFVQILKYGAPAALQMSVISFAHLLIMRLINSFGHAALAGITAVGRIDSLAIMPVATLSMAMSTVVAQNMGARLEDRAIRGFKIGAMYMLGYAVVISAILMIFAPQLISMFIDQDDAYLAQIITVGQQYLSIMVIFYFLFAILFSFVGFFRGVGDAMMAMVVTIISLTIRTASAYGLVLFAGMGPEALAWSIPMGWGISGIICWVYYRKRRWVGKVAV